jgi:formate C-acetyltransferase
MDLTSQTLEREPRTRETARAHATEPKAPWRGFNPGLWQREINVRWFIQQNYTPYDGDRKFLSGATHRTRRLWKKL